MGLNYIQSIYQQFNNGKPTRVPPELKALILEVLEEVLGAEEAAKVKANAFIGVSPEPYIWGSLDSFQMMLPGTMAHRSQKEFDLSQYQFGSRLPSQASHKLSQEEMESDDVFVFKQSVLLTENAKKFVVARELERARQALFLDTTGSGTYASFMSYFL